jgi:C4-dicarboxylate transporter/malic acid transport protein
MTASFLSPETSGSRARGRFLHALEGASPFAFVGPNWFASVMGTGIIANAAATLPVGSPLLSAFARGMWCLAVVLLVTVSVATALHWAGHRDTARGHLADPVMSHFYGAPAMALMTVGAGALLVGSDLIGARAAVAVDVVLWTGGTAFGLWTAFVVPYLMFTRHHPRRDEAFGGWLMPVVPPMVSAATGALLIPHLPVGQPRLTLLLGCYAMFGCALLSSLFIISLIWSRLTHDGIGSAAAVPTLWIVLGPLGQSVTAVHNLGQQADGTYAPALRVFAIVYGIPVWGFAMMWLAVVMGITLRTARHGLPFGLTWWSFTFPVGTVVTGTSGLAAATADDVLKAGAVALFAGLVAAWLTVALRTARGVWSGHLLLAPSPVSTPGSQTA